MSMIFENAQNIYWILEPIDTRLGLMQSDIKELQSDVKGMQLRIDKMQGGMEKIQDNIGGMPVCIEEMQTSMAEMQARMKEIQGTLNSVKGSQVKLEVVHLPEIRLTLDNFVANSERSVLRDMRISVLEIKAGRFERDIAYLKSVVRG